MGGSKISDSKSSSDPETFDSQKAAVVNPKVTSLKKALTNAKASVLSHNKKKAVGGVKSKEVVKDIGNGGIKINAGGSKIQDIVKPTDENSNKSKKRPGVANHSSRNVKKPRVQPLFEALRVHDEFVTEDEQEADEVLEEGDGEFELTFGKDQCEKCPGCKSLMVSSNTNISINVANCCYIINCIQCGARITLKNALSERQRQFLYSNLNA